MADDGPSFESNGEFSGATGQTVQDGSEQQLEFITDDESTGQRSRPCKESLLQVDLNIEKIISKNKSDSMFELRKLTHQQRPVSAFSSKQTLEEFLAKQSNRNKSDGATSLLKSNAAAGMESEQDSSNSEVSLNVSEHVQQFVSASQPEGLPSTSLMPEEIQLEMQNLNEQRIVYGILQGPVHEEIDRSLREGMEHRRSHRRPRPRPYQQADNGEEGGDEISQISTPPVGRLLSMGGHSRRQRRSGRRVRFRPQPPIPNADGRYPVPHRNQRVIVDQLRQSPALNTLGEEARDEIVAEVSSLVSQQLVTSALSGEFRGVLELHIQSRADQINQGELPGPFVGGNIPQEYRDDQRELVNPSSAHLRELHEEMVMMKGQLNELKQMMRVSFDLQLDIQRAIRQEVAAALTCFLSPNLVPAASNGAQSLSHTCPIPTLGPQQSNLLSSSRISGSGDTRGNVMESGHCVICSEGVIDSVIYHCGHMCTCMACGLELKSKTLKCPICRAPITDVIRTYTSML